MRRKLVSGLLLAAVAGCTVVNPKPADDKALLTKQVTPPPAAVSGWQPPAGTNGGLAKVNGPGTGVGGAPIGTPPQTPFAVKTPTPAAPPSPFGQGASGPVPGTTTQLATNYQPPSNFRTPMSFQPVGPVKPPQPAGTYPMPPTEPVTPAGCSEVRTDEQGLSATTLAAPKEGTPLPPLSKDPPAPLPPLSKDPPAPVPPPLPTSVVADHQSTPEVPPTMVASAPAMRMVNSKRFTLNYEIKDAGSGGPPPVDLWCTTDMRQWKKWDAQQQGTHAYVVEVKEEGTYGFTLVARTGAQLGGRPPVPGDTPQVWVTVDATKPAVQMTGLELSLTSKVPSLILRWTARDKNFGPRPVTLAYAVQPEGPWTLIAQNVENNGRFEWPLPPNMPSAMYVRIEAADLVGNTGVVVTPNPIPINANWVSATAPAPVPEAAKTPLLPRPTGDPVHPAASIVNVEVGAVQPAVKD